MSKERARAMKSLKSRSDSELPTPSEPTSSNDGNGSGCPLHTTVPPAPTGNVPGASIGAAQAQGTVLRRSKRLRGQAGSPMLVVDPCSPERGPSAMTTPAVTPPAAAESQSVGGQGTVLRQSKRLRGQTGTPTLAEEAGSPGRGLAMVTEPVHTPPAAAESQSLGTCQEEPGLVRPSRRAKIGTNGSGGGSPEASAVSGPPADTSLHACPKRRPIDSSAGADSGRAADVKKIPEELNARVTAILATSDLHQMTMRQVSLLVTDICATSEFIPKVMSSSLKH